MTDEDFPLLTREQTPGFLEQELGIPIKAKTFEGKCLRGEGPPVAQYWGRRPLYSRTAVKTWALGRLRPATVEAA